MRVRPGGSHHMKLVVLRHPGRPGRDVAFVGGIDLCHSRRDDSAHFGDPQRQPMAAVYGSRPPWHDIQALIRGPAVASGEPIGAAASFAGMFEAFGQAADALDARHPGGRRGPRPAGQLRRYPEPLIPASTRAWASVLYRLVYDPDGRPPAMRRAYEAAASRSPTGSQTGKPMRPRPGHLHADQMVVGYTRPRSSIEDGLRAAMRLIVSPALENATGRCYEGCRRPRRRLRHTTRTRDSRCSN